MKIQAQMASFVVVGQNAEFFKHSITAELDSEVLRSTPEYFGVNWEYFKVLWSYSGVLRNTPEYSRVLPSTPKYSKALYGENINFCYV
eukprot:scaffold33616_cov153-Skeletonema_dohrnii-CCMP3373.AAC.1